MFAKTSHNMPNASIPEQNYEQGSWFLMSFLSVILNLSGLGANFGILDAFFLSLPPSSLYSSLFLYCSLFYSSTLLF